MKTTLNQSQINKLAWKLARNSVPDGRGRSDRAALVWDDFKIVARRMSDEGVVTKEDFARKMAELGD